MVDLSPAGIGLIAAGAALIPLFIHFRGHAEKFRSNSRTPLNAIRSRLANQLFIDFMTKSVELIDNLLEQDGEDVAVRARLVEALSSEESPEEAILEIREILEERPTTPEQRRRIKDFTKGLLEKFESREEVSKSYEKGWKEEQKCGSRIIRLMLLLVGLGVFLLTLQLILSSVTLSEVSYGMIVIIGVALAWASLTTAAEIIRAYTNATSAQNRFDESVDSELYDIPTSTE